MNPATIAIAAALVLIPGLGATLAAYPPGRIGSATRLALTFGLGYAVVGITAVVLVIARVLHPETFFPALAIVTAGLWAGGLRRGGVRAHLDAVSDEFGRERWTLAVGALVFVAIAIVRLRSSPLLNFEMFGPWRYWADGLEIADAGRVPAHTLQWGSFWTPTVSKVVLNSYHAALSYAIGRAPLPAMGALLVARIDRPGGRPVGARPRARPAPAGAAPAAADPGGAERRAAPQPRRVHRRERRPDGGGVRADPGGAGRCATATAGRSRCSRRSCSGPGSPPTACRWSP